MAKAQPQPQPPAEGRSESLLGLEVLVFVGGAVVMALEIAGSRLLAPHFGNSVYVWGSLISVFLMALAGGYMIGGHVADRRPTFASLSTICLVASGLIFLVPFLGNPLCRALLDAGCAERTGPLLAAFALFLPASVLLGMVSPYAIRLAATDVVSLGRAAGKLYALSTLGSIVGTLATTFVLIPHVGLTWILRGLGLAMLLVPAAVVILRTRRAGVIVPVALVAAIGLSLPASASTLLEEGEKVRLEAETPYHRIFVTDMDPPGVRLLRFDRFVESSIGIEPPHPTWSAYTNYFHLAFLVRPEIKRALFIGAGGGIGPRTFLAVNPAMQVDVVDIDQKVLDVARDLFFMPQSPNLRPIARDGRMFVMGSTDKYDCIVLDAFTIGGRIPFHLTTREFFELCRAHLEPGGVFVMNTNTALSGDASGIYFSVARTLQDAFPHVAAFGQEFAVDRDPLRSRNVLFVCSPDAPLPTVTELAERLPGYAARSTITHAMLRAMTTDALTLPDLSGVTPFTDDFAPIETMRFQ